MNLGQQILFLLYALGAVNGTILGLYLILHRKKRSLASILLGVLLLAMSIRVGKSVFVSFNPGLPRIYLQLGLSGCFLIGPSLYYFTRTVLEKVTKVPASWKWIWGIQLAALVLTGIVVPYETNRFAWNHVIVHIIYAQWAAYLVATGVLLIRTGGSRFLNILLAGNCFIFLAYLGAFMSLWSGFYLGGALSFTFVLYLTIFFNLNGAGFGNASPRPERKKIPENDAKTLLERLDKALLDNELYKDPNLKLSDLAQKINIPPHQLSQLLNDNLGKSFSTYINEYRITEACKLITSNDLLTFEAIGYEVGYNSKSTFYAAFRKIKDTTPALYKESIENQAG
ncbi:helix-turn-helix domain-containing protein [Chitinophaga sp. 22620]|uniref:helix-turn-helix domain-containing protein n=1 Tax=Chitinophaga sp. 22620 TaxID=3453952 RepID=UPI003F86B3E9